MSEIILISILFLMLISTKRVRIFSATILVFFILYLVYTNTTNPDYENYKYAYDNILVKNIFSFEMGFNLIMYAGKIIGLDYNLFILIIYTISIVIVYFIFKSLNLSMDLFLLFYTIFPLFMDLIQVRHFIAMIMYTLSLIALSKGRNVKSLFLMILATQFHILTVLFIPLCILKYKRIKSVSPIITLITITIFIFSLFGFLTGIGELTFIQKYGSKLIPYLTTKMSWGLIYFTVVGVIYFTYMLTLERAFNNNINLFSYSEIELFRINKGLRYLLIIYYPLILINSNFTRILRIPLIITYLLSTILIYKLKRKDSIQIYITTIIFSVLMFSLLILTEFENIVGSYLK